MKEFLIGASFRTYTNGLRLIHFVVEANNIEEVQQKAFFLLLEKLKAKEDSETLEAAVFDFNKVTISIAENDNN